MKKATFLPSQIFRSAIVLLALFSQTQAEEVDPTKLAGLHGGLIVQLGASQTQAAAELSLTGRYLIHVLEPDAQAVEAAQANIRKNGRYGLAWAEQPVNRDRLPYAENLVNLIVIRDYTVPVPELLRVLVPGGAVVVADQKVIQKAELEAGGFGSFATVDSHLIAQKAWPKAME